jgi:glycosyltransferase involved in cell wall biosynthesis
MTAVESSAAAPSPRIAYVVSQYPASSHTFISREIEAVRAAGLHIETFSIRRPSDAELRADRDRLAYASTSYVLPARPGKVLAAHVGALMRGPARYASALALALRHRAPGVRALIWAGFHFVEAVMLAHELRKRRIDRVHNHFANAGATVGMLAARIIGVPWSLTLHGISETDYPAGLTLSDKVAFADFVACVSWFGRAQAMRITAPRFWPKMRIVRCGLDLPALDPLRTPGRTAADIVCVGRLSPEKGHLGLLDACAALSHDGLDVDLVLVGDGPDRASIEERIAQLGLQARVRLVGRLDEAGTLARIASSKLLVLPSFMEGLPIVLMEAMALGVPVVASRVAGVPELIEDGLEGLLFRPGDWDDLAAKMRSLLNGEVARDAMVARARAKVEREFDVVRAVRPLLPLLSDVGGRPSA